MLFYTSELEEVQRVCDRAIVIFGGRVVDVLPVEIADEAALTRAAYGLPRGAQADVGVLAGRPLRDASGRAVIHFLRRQGWVVGLFALFVVLLVVTRLIQPGYGGGDFGSLVRAVLPYAFAVAAQTVVVIAGGIDLSVASMMALTSVTAAAHDGRRQRGIRAARRAVRAAAWASCSAPINGLLIVVTRVPDIVVTLATLFVLQGAALLVLDAPGGAAAEWLKALIVGTVPIPGVPDGDRRPGCRRRCVVLLVCLGIIWIPLRRSRLGLSIYAIGSSELAAFRSGVPVARTKIIAYALAGSLRRHGRAGADHEHRHRRADPRALSAGQRRGGGARRRRRSAAAAAAWSARSSRSSSCAWSAPT